MFSKLQRSWMKTLKNVTTEVKNGKMVQTLHWSDGSKELKHISDEKVEKLMFAIMNERFEPPLKVIKGGKSERGNAGILILGLLVFGALYVIAGQVLDMPSVDKCRRPGWAKYSECL